MRFALLPLLLLIPSPTFAEQAVKEGITSSEILYLMVAVEVCPEVANPEAVEAALQAMDDATPTDIRSFLLVQQGHLLDWAEREGEQARKRLCETASIMVDRHRTFAR